MAAPERIDMEQWDIEHKQALSEAHDAYYDIIRADEIEGLHERVKQRSDARERFDNANAKLDLLHLQWGHGWRDQNGNKIES